MNLFIAALLFLQDDITVTKVDNLAIVKGPAAKYKVRIRDKEATEHVSAPGIIVVEAGDATRVTVDDKEIQTRTPTYVPALPGVTVTPREGGCSVANSGSSAVVVIVKRTAENRGIAAWIVQPGQTENIEIPGNCSMDVIDPSSYTGIMHRPKAEPRTHEQEDWSQPGVFINTRPPRFAGILPEIKGLLGRDLEMHVDPWVRTIGAFTIIDTIELKDFNCYGFGVTIDLTLIQISVEGGSGDFEAEGVQIHIDNGTGFITDVFDQTYDGSMWWIKVGVYWPALIYTSGTFHASLGPDFNYLYIEEDFDTRRGPGLTFDFHRRYTERAYTVGGRVSVAFSNFTFQAAGSRSFGDLTGGSMFEVLAGYELRM